MDDKNDQQWKWVGKTVNHVTPLQLRTIWGRICVRFCYNFSVRFWRLHCVNALYFVIADALFSLPSFFFFLFHFSTEIFARFSSIETSAIGLKLWHCAEWHQFNNRPFRYASPCLWNQLPKELRLTTDHEDLSSDLTHVSSSFPSSPLSPYITPSHFHSRLKTYLFHKSFPP